MKTEKLIREFKYGSLSLADPDPTQTPEEVKAFYANVYPELNNAEVEGPDRKENKTVYTFRKAVGTKGVELDGVRGLYKKFVVYRTDGKSQPGRKHANCEYFVLDLDHDKHAIPALEAYARACRVEFPQLSSDLLDKADALRAKT